MTPFPGQLRLVVLLRGFDIGIGPKLLTKPIIRAVCNGLGINKPKRDSMLGLELTIRASSIATARTQASGLTGPANLLSVDPATFYSSNIGFPQWVPYRLPSARRLTRYRLRARNDNTFRPSGWRILGSNDGVNFTLVNDVL